ncbi:MAG: hypothetical protein R2942_16350 [Ignavibacteria bacterium]
MKCCMNLKEIITDEFEKNAFDAFNIIPWLESRVKKDPNDKVAEREGKEVHKIYKVCKV